MLSPTTIARHKQDRIQRIAAQHVVQVKQANKPALIIPVRKKP